jgi:hypothetical protein
MKKKIIIGMANAPHIAIGCGEWANTSPVDAVPRIIFSANTFGAWSLIPLPLFFQNSHIKGTVQRDLRGV